MECPKCGKKVGERDAVCRNCGVILDVDDDDKKKKKKQLPAKTNKRSKKRETLLPSLDTTGLGTRNMSVSKTSEGKMKFIMAAVVVVLIIILVWVLIVQLASGKGLKTAEKTAQYIGSTVSEAEKAMDIHFKDSSAFSMINNAAVFDYIYESEDKLEIDDVSFPEWSVAVIKDQSEFIERIVYTDYTVLKKDSRGKRIDKRINLDKFNKGDKYSSVNDAVGLDPFRITYDISTVSYQYRYCYTDSVGDTRSVVLNVVYDDNNKYLYYTSVDLYPQFM